MSASLTLYELANLRDLLDAQLAETDGVLTPELEQQLDQLAGDIKEKVERVGLYIREQAATAKAIQEEADRLQSRAAAKLAAAEGLKGYLKAQMERLGLAKVDGLLCTVALQANSAPSVRTNLQPHELYAIDDARPYVTREEKVIYALDRSSVLAAWKNGQALPAPIVVERGSHVRVK